MSEPYKPSSGSTPSQPGKPAAPGLYEKTRADATSPAQPGQASGPSSSAKPVEAKNLYGATQADAAPDQSTQSASGVRRPAREVYEIVHLIGEGGMGSVHLARDIQLDRWIALKRMSNEFVSNSRLLERFRIEGRSVAALNHFHIVNIFAMGEDTEGPYIAMEYVGGPPEIEVSGWPSGEGIPRPPLNLDDFIKRNGPMPVDKAIALLRKLCSAVEFAHQKKVIHRDIKPANILLDERLEPKLTDFGLARQMDQQREDKTMMGASVGSRGYMAPEQEINAATVDHRADLYALGGTFWFMLTGHKPEHFRESEVPAAVRPVLVKAMERDREKRFKSAAEFEKALGRPSPSPSLGGFEVDRVICLHCEAPNKDGDVLCARCGKPITTPCLKCGKTMSCSRPACGSCGAVQADILADLERDAQQRFEAAGKAKQDLHFADATAALQPIAMFAHPQLQPLADRAKSELQQIQNERGGWDKKITAAIVAVWPKFAAGQFAGLADQFKGIPRPIWTPRMVRIAADAEGHEARVAKSKKLLATGLTPHLNRSKEEEAESAAEAAKLRERFKKYVRKVRHHTQQELPDKLKVVSATVHYSRLIVLTSVYESRTTSINLRPYQGEKLPPRTIAPPQLDPWGCQLPITEEVESKTIDYVIPETQAVLNCAKCNASGAVVCGECAGKKIVTCKTCKGKKNVRCKACDGRGRQERTRKVQRYSDCTTCRGTGKVMNVFCFKCNGSGRMEFNDRETFTVPCDECAERGQVACTTCKASGEVHCPTCQASGSVTCPVCAGRRQVIEAAVVHQCLATVNSQTNPTTQVSIPKEVYEQLEVETHYELVGTTVSPELTPFAFRESKPHELVAGLQQLLANVAPADDRSRIVRQRVNVHTAWARELNYRFQKKDYTCWVAGNRLYAPINPITNELEQTVRDAMSEGKGDRGVALALADAREMAKDDEFCAQALDRIKKEVPEEVWKWSRNVWSAEKKLTVLIGGSAAAVGGLLLLIGILAHVKVLTTIALLVAVIGAIVFAIGWFMGRK